MEKGASNRAGGVSRRGFLKGVGFAGLALGATGGLAGCLAVTPAGSMFAAPGVSKEGYQYATCIILSAS